MATLRKDYLKIGGHKWALIEEMYLNRFGVSIPTGNEWHECSACCVIASMAGSHGECKPTPKESDYG